MGLKPYIEAKVSSHIKIIQQDTIMKIALIAMSGIRACDPELLKLGLTLPGFVERSTVIASLPSLGLLTLAGMTPQQHECHYIEIADIRDVKELPVGFDLVAISSFSAQINEAYQLADQYRERNIPVVLGGLHVTSAPDEALLHCDAVIIGEGEAVWLQLLDDAEGSRLQQKYSSHETGYDLADAPMPAFHMLEIEKYNRLTIQTSRGCPHLCEFCASSVLLTPQYKQKPVQNVLNEMDKILEIWKRPFIEFADDNSIINKSYWKELLPQIKTRGIRWFTETDLSLYKDGELLEMMKDSGCVEVLVGFESPDQPSLHKMELKNDWKLKKWSEYKESIAAIQSHGIRVNACFIFGLDEQDESVFDEVYEFVMETNPFDVQITLQTPFPGTPLYSRLENEDRLLYPNQWERCTLFDVNYQPKKMSAEKLANGFRNLGVKLYDEEHTAKRRDHFKRNCMRTARSA